MAGRGGARLGRARQGEVGMRRGPAGHGEAWRGLAGRGKARRGRAGINQNAHNIRPGKLNRQSVRLQTGRDLVQIQAGAPGTLKKEKQAKTERRLAL